MNLKHNGNVIYLGKNLMSSSEPAKHSKQNLLLILISSTCLLSLAISGLHGRGTGPGQQAQHWRSGHAQALPHMAHQSALAPCWVVLSFPKLQVVVLG